ncbi:MAG: hypothetical protein R3249_00145 [Nitriliruptorales bacterium]|nr:hypothetical protein [Nitriliruptorales bacterium]
MYRDDPLDDEAELRDLLGDAAVDQLAAAGQEVVAAACDISVVLLGWAPANDVSSWFQRPQERLDGRSPLAALVAGNHDDVEDVARRWAAAQG